MQIETNTTLIRATHRVQDLLPTFLGAIKSTPEYDQIMQSNNENYRILTDPTADDDDPRWESDDIIYLLEELFDILNHYAPDGYYFGAHVGDGSDFGFWEVDDELFV